MLELLTKQRIYFQTGATRNYEARKHALQSLRAAIAHNETAISQALAHDLRKSPTETYMSEIGLILGEIDYALKHLRNWMRPKKYRTPLANFPARQRILYEPFGIVLILVPWNYPFLLALSPLIGALAAGNCCIVKPSEFAPSSATTLTQIVHEAFDEKLVDVLNGDADLAKALLEEKFDYIFYTGNSHVARYVMEKAAQNLTPLTLELGGKSPVIVTRSANIQLAARRIAFGKFLNCGQTCIAPDYILVEDSVHDTLVQCLCDVIKDMFGEKPLENPEYGKIINQRHFERLVALLIPEKIVYGGQTAPSSLQISPTLLDHVTPSDRIMQEEIFGPLLPILSTNNIEQAINFIQERPHPLALYIFTKDKKLAQRIFREISFGGGCINDVISHIASTNLPFGGIGASGFGAYHGHESFTTFCHKKALLKRGTWLEPTLRYPPYTKWKQKLLRYFL